MKQRGLAGVGGAAQDVEPKRCRLDRTVFFGAIIVTDGLKSGKRNAHKNKKKTKGRTKNYLEGTNVCRGYL